MKRLLLMGTALLSIASYASAMNRNQQNNRRSQTSSGIEPTNSRPNSIRPQLNPLNEDVTEYPPHPNALNNNRVLSHSEEAKVRALHEQWNNKIVPALSNQEISLDTFKDLIAPLTEICNPSSSGYRISEKLSLELSVLNPIIINTLKKISYDLINIEAMLDKKTDSEINEIIENNPEIKNDLNVMNKLSSLPYNNLEHLYKTISSEEATAIFQSLINFASSISQLKKPLHDWFIKNNIHYFLQNTAYFFATLWVYDHETGLETLEFIPFHLKDFTESPLYSAENGFNSLAIAILSPYYINYKMKQIPEFLLEEPNSKPDPKIVSDFVRGFINYTICIIQDLKKLHPIDVKYIIKSLKNYFYLTTASDDKESAIDIIDNKQQKPTLSDESERTLDSIECIIECLGLNADLTKASLCSFNDGKSVIDIIDNKQQDPNLSEESKEVLKVVQRVILENIIYTSSFQKAIEDYIISDKIPQDILDDITPQNILEEFKKLLGNAKIDHIKIAIDSTLKWVDKESYRCVSVPKRFRTELTRLKKYRDPLATKKERSPEEEKSLSLQNQEITKLKRLKMLYEIFSAYKDEVKS